MDIKELTSLETSGKKTIQELTIAGIIFVFFIIPWIIPSFRVMDVLAKIMIFTIAVASFDLLLGYTGILSFAHGMFFGIGAYSIALILYHSDTPSGYHIFLAAGASIAISVVISLMISFFSLRVKAIFFAMLTLALAEFAHILGVQWSDLTGGADGISFTLPGIFNFGQTLGTLFNTQINGRLMVYYFILVIAVFLFTGMLRFIHSPLGRVLKAIRENEQRTIALGYKTFRYQTCSIVFSACIASLSGILFAMWLCYVNPDSVFHTAIMVNILLMVLIGGMGTLYGSLIGAGFFIVTENWLPGLLKSIAGLASDSVILANMADRWQLYFGILFVLVVIFFPKGVIGTFRVILDRRHQLHSS
ncbi:MAG: branched-chain amino acid ABC transporter permease [Deltaproteobacteria bacterium]|uniref:branched-chain amino acid ABC transporter permease n=1 Tax=Desulfobacula sp. TaxID=2593537 RepID=UPI0019BE6683|nr:branched-chain amino acid ABC transporter permease [Candidatus Desulfobacula maris]MBL6993921.1 branched-chain amino acid ABC transporter permease [Desulfobacula sp.]